MSGFVALAHLPLDTDTLLIGEKYAELLRFSLEKLGINTLLIPDNPYVDPRLSGHADLSVFHAGGERLHLAPYLKGSVLHKKLLTLGAEPEFPAITQGASYPLDAGLNACAAGTRLIFAPGITAREIVDYFTNIYEADLIASRQGYVNCSLCVVDAHSMITSDRGLAKRLSEEGLDVLLIRPGFIELPGFSYGFIGGAAFRISRNRIAFTGRLDKHPDKEKILSFLQKRGFQAAFLTEKALFDIGGALPFLEKE